jgi:hypothetical protein
MSNSSDNQEPPTMTTQEVLKFLQISRASLYRLYIAPGLLTPIRNPNLKRPHLKFRAADVRALVPTRLDAAPPRMMALEPPYSTD